MKVCTFNIRYDTPDDGEFAFKYRQDKIMNLLEEEAFDLIGFQEVLPHVQAFLVSTLINYGNVYQERGLEDPESSPIFYNKDKFSYVDCETFWLNEGNIKYQIGWDAACIRICTWCHLIDKATGKDIHIFNAHLDHISANAQLKGMAQILGRIKSLEASSKVILLGDFNCEPDSEVIKLIKETLNEAIEVTQKKKGPSWTFHDYHKTQLRIDYIFISSDIKVSKTCIYDDEIVSDHYPYFADLEI